MPFQKLISSSPNQCAVISTENYQSTVEYQAQKITAVITTGNCAAVVSSPPPQPDPLHQIGCYVNILRLKRPEFRGRDGLSPALQREERKKQSRQEEEAEPSQPEPTPWRAVCLLLSLSCVPKSEDTFGCHKGGRCLLSNGQRSGTHLQRQRGPAAVAAITLC